MKIIITICLIALAQSAFAQVILNGPCPEVTTPLAHNFKLSKYSGVWHGIESIPFLSRSSCTTGNYEVNNDGTITLHTSGISPITGKAFEITFPGRVIKPAELSFKYGPTQNLDEPNYIVYGTNYINWAAVGYCKNLDGNKREQTAFVLGRNKKLSETHLQSAHAALENAKIDLSLLEPTDQTHCN